MQQDTHSGEAPATKRKIRMGMIGGGQGGFIGAVHRIAAAIDQQIELVWCLLFRPPTLNRLGKELF